jgi:hypothetical protein
MIKSKLVALNITLTIEESRAFTEHLSNIVGRANVFLKEQNQTKVISFTKRYLSEILRKPSRIDWAQFQKLGNFPIIKHLPIGKTGPSGQILLIFEGLRYNISIENSVGGGHPVFIEQTALFADGLEVQFRIDLTSGGTIYKRMQIGDLTKTVNGAGSYKGTSKEVLVIDARLGTFAVTWAITRSLHFNWTDAGKLIPKMVGLYMGKTDPNGRINLTPFPRYRHYISVLGFEEAGWDIHIIKAYVSDGIFNIDFSAEKGGRETLYPTFQAGTELLYLDGIRESKGVQKPVLALSSQLGLSTLVNLIGQPLDVSWHRLEELGQLRGLKGLKLVDVQQNGQLSITVKENFKLSVPILGSKQSGWSAYLVGYAISENSLLIDIQFRKKGHLFREKTFQLGPDTMEIPGYGPKASETLTTLSFREVLSVEEVLKQEGKAFLADLLLFDTDTDWEQKTQSGRLDALKDLFLGKTDGSGRIILIPKTNFKVPFRVLGFNGEGWNVKIKSFEAKKQLLYLYVEATKEYETSIQKVFQMGAISEDIQGIGINDHETLTSLVLSDELATKGLALLIKGTLSHFESEGMRLGKTNQDGQIYFVLGPYDPVMLRVISKRESNWEAELVNIWTEDNLIHFKTKATFKGKETQVFTFQINPRTRDIYRVGDTLKSTLATPAPRITAGKEVLKELVQLDNRLIDDFHRGKIDHLLKGYYLGQTSGNGALPFHIAPNIGYHWTVLGVTDRKWHLRVVDEWTDDFGRYFFELNVTSEDETFKKTFFISPKQKTIEKNNQAPYTILEIMSVQDAGKRLLTNMLDPSSTLLPAFQNGTLSHLLSGLKLGTTGAGGIVLFQVGAFIASHYSGFGNGEPGWVVSVTDEWLGLDGAYQFRIRLSKDGCVDEKDFQLGPFTKTISRSDRLATILSLNNIKDLGKQILGKLVLPDSPLIKQFEEGTITSVLRGYHLGTLIANGALFFSVNKDYGYSWPAFGRKDTGWESVVTREWMSHGYFQFEVVFMKEDKTVSKTFQVGPFQKVISSRTSGTMDVLMIQDVALMRKQLLATFGEGS